MDYLEFPNIEDDIDEIMHYEAISLEELVELHVDNDTYYFKPVRYEEGDVRVIRFDDFIYRLNDVKYAIRDTIVSNRLNSGSFSQDRVKSKEHCIALLRDYLRFTLRETATPVMEIVPDDEEEDDRLDISKDSSLPIRLHEHDWEIHINPYLYIIDVKGLILNNKVFYAKDQYQLIIPAISVISNFFRRDGFAVCIGNFHYPVKAIRLNIELLNHYGSLYADMPKHFKDDEEAFEFLIERCCRHIQRHIDPVEVDETTKDGRYVRERRDVRLPE